MSCMPAEESQDFGNALHDILLPLYSEEEIFNGLAMARCIGRRRHTVASSWVVAYSCVHCCSEVSETFIQDAFPRPE
jgi:hypothetical protein